MYIYIYVKYYYYISVDLLWMMFPLYKSPLVKHRISKKFVVFDVWTQDSHKSIRQVSC